MHLPLISQIDDYPVADALYFSFFINIRILSRLLSYSSSLSFLMAPSHC